MKYAIRNTRVTVIPEGEPLYSKFSTDISIEDDFSKEYVILEQEDGKVCIAKEAWPLIRRGVEKMFAELRERVDVPELSEPLIENPNDWLITGGQEC